MKRLIFILLFISLPLLSAAWNLDVADPSDTCGVSLTIGNLTNFLQLTDTPNVYTGEGGNCVAVHAGEGALEFISCATGGGDGNASSICAGNTTYLSGEGSCNDVSILYAPNTTAGIQDLINNTGIYDALADTNFSTACSAGEYGDGGGTCINLNNSIDYKIAAISIGYNATNISTVEGTLDDGNVTFIWGCSDATTYNVSEDSGAAPLLIEVNFTNIVEFNLLHIRGRYLGGSGHTMDIQIFNFDTVSWDTIDGAITDQPAFTELSLPIFNSDSYINDTNVSVRIDHVQSGITSHDYFLDCMHLAQQAGTVFGGEHDGTIGRDDCTTNHPNALCANGSIRNATHIIVSNNVTASWIKAYLNWSWIQDIPDYVKDYASTILSINTTKNIQNLLNSTGVYNTNNDTYANYETNVSRNWSKNVYDTWNTVWSAGGGDFNFDDYQASFDLNISLYETNITKNHTKSVYDNWNTLWSTLFVPTNVAWTNETNLFTENQTMQENLTIQENLIMTEEWKICYDGAPCQIYKTYNGSCLIEVSNSSTTYIC